MTHVALILISECQCATVRCIPDVVPSSICHVLNKMHKIYLLRLLSLQVRQNNRGLEYSTHKYAGPSMFGRDLAEQVRADSKDEDRHIPIIVEKCIDAVDALGVSPNFHSV